MTLLELLTELARRGVMLRADHGSLVADFPNGGAEALRDELRSHEADLLEMALDGGEIPVRLFAPPLPSGGN